MGKKKAPADYVPFIAIHKSTTEGTALERLKAMIADDTLHHATYRNRGTLWEGIWFYRKSDGPLSFQGYEVAGCVNKRDPDYEDAYKLLAGNRLYVGAYGGG